MRNQQGCEPSESPGRACAVNLHPRRFRRRSFLLGAPDGLSSRAEGPGRPPRRRVQRAGPATVNPAPLGVFDSGIGGLTVARALFERLPRESVIYFGDTARVPYGPKSPDTVRRYGGEI